MKLKKPRFWDYKKPNFYAYLLYPLSLLFNLINQIKINPKKKFKIKTICIGNFYVGGTGKTSLSIKIKEILNKRKIKSCFIKKIYNDQFDEQNILRNKGDLFLAKKRHEALQKAENANYDLAILDDGLQDKSIKYDVSIVCFNNINWIGNGMTFPSGPLRESLENIKNYKHVFLNGNLENLEFLKKEILNLNSEINIHVGKYEAINIDEFDMNNNYFVFSGIGNHQTFISMLKNYGLKIIKDLEFADHYQYSNKDINKIINDANSLGCKIITTEKDYLRLKDKYFNEIKYIKSNLKILNEEEFIKSVIK
tara:strand:+ start:3008 stop:3934 length:927 start_codon:yes stop_codon:yes gene_type:complete